MLFFSFFFFFSSRRRHTRWPRDWSSDVCSSDLAASLGIDDLEHGLVVDTEFFPWKRPGQCPDQPNAMDFISKLEVNTGPVHDMILDLVRHHVSVTSTLPVFEMFVPGRPAIQPRVLDGL